MKLTDRLDTILINERSDLTEQQRDNVLAFMFCNMHSEIHFPESDKAAILEAAKVLYPMPYYQ
jgi:hypothetical protein